MATATRYNGPSTKHYSKALKPALLKDWSYCMMASDHLSYVNSQEWGYEIKYKKIALMPNLAIKNFALETPDGRITVKKWKDVPFSVQDFNFYQYCQDKYPDLLD